MAGRAKYWENAPTGSLNRAATKDKVVGFQDCWDIVEPILTLAQKVISVSLTNGEWENCLICGIGTPQEENVHADDCDLVLLRIYLRSLKFAGEEEK